MAATEITTPGYQSVRDFIQGLASTSWQYLALINGASAEVLRLKIGTDPRVSWTHTAGARTLQITAVIKGSDADITALLPLTLASGAIYQASSGGSPMHGVQAFAEGNATLSATGDQITVNYTIDVPALA